MTTKILVVGCNSFLADRFRAVSKLAGQCDFVSHRHLDAAEPNELGRYDCIVNFAIDPAYRSARYATDHDFDLRLAELVRSSTVRYVMMSSRAVYSRDHAVGATETDPALGNNSAYSRNKLETERRLGDVLGERLTVLRIANIIGDESDSGRRTFMSQALDRLRTANEISLDISPDVRRDFLPDTHFVRVLDAVLNAPCGGALNVGSGLAVPVGDVAGWLIEGYGTGQIVVTDHRVHDEFVLNVDRLHSTYGIDCTLEEIAAHCRRIGRNLHRS